MFMLDAAGLARFRALRQEAVDSVTQRFYVEQGAIYERFGDAGREACRDDLTFHLEFLQPVLELGVLQPMVDYLRWLASVLAARDIPAEHVGLSLDWMAEFFDARMDPADAHAVTAALRAARARLMELGPAPDTIELTAPAPWPECDPFEVLLLAGNIRGAVEIVDALLEQGRGLVEIEMHVIQPALYAVGREWQANEVSVAQEHLATAIAQTAMTHGLLRSDAAPPNEKRVLLSCVEGNIHAVGLQMVADAFQLGGWEVQYLGANVPTASLVGHVEAWQPDLLALSMSFVWQMPVVREIIARLNQSLGEDRPPVMVGGLAINRFDNGATLIGADAWSSDATSAVATGERLVG